MKAIHVRTLGLKCDDCSSSVEAGISNLQGVIGVTSTHERDVTSVVFNESLTGREEIVDAIRASGFEAHYVEDSRVGS